MPSLQHTAFSISLLSCYFNLAKATEGKLPKDYLCVELSKNLHILSFISISFFLNWSLYSWLALAVF